MNGKRIGFRRFAGFEVSFLNCGESLGGLVSQVCSIIHDININLSINPVRM